jgi:hypothetical protein
MYMYKKKLRPKNYKFVSVNDRQRGQYIGRFKRSCIVPKWKRMSYTHFNKKLWKFPVNRKEKLKIGVVTSSHVRNYFRGCHNTDAVSRSWFVIRNIIINCHLPPLNYSSTSSFISSFELSLSFH